MSRVDVGAGWRGDLERWLAPLMDGLGHKARRRMCPLPIADLIGPGDRKSIHPMTERLGLGAHDQLQHFVAAGTWDSAPLLKELARQADTLLGGEGAVLVVDDTALPKKGSASVGVAPEYASALGKQANCQTLVSPTLGNRHPPPAEGLWGRCRADLPPPGADARARTTSPTRPRRQPRRCWPARAGGPSSGAAAPRGGFRRALRRCACASPTGRRSGSAKRATSTCPARRPGSSASGVQGRAEVLLLQPPGRHLAARPRRRHQAALDLRAGAPAAGGGTRSRPLEGRSWIGLHRHALMAMIAYAFLQHQRLAMGKGKKASAGPPPEPSLPAVRRAVAQHLFAAHSRQCPHCHRSLDGNRTNLLPK